MKNQKSKFEYLFKEAKEEITKEKEAYIKYFLKDKLKKIECLKKEIGNKQKEIQQLEELIENVTKTGELPSELQPYSPMSGGLIGYLNSVSPIITIV